MSLHRSARIRPRVRHLPRGLPALALALLATSAAQAQIGCRSDGQPAPAALFERFLSSDCDTCWADVRTPTPGPAALLLDWIAPGTQGDEAPLSAAALVEASARLHDLGRSAPAPTAVHVAATAPAPGRLRVAHGLPVSGYLGAAIEWRGRPLPPGRYRTTLALIEHLPAGAEGTGPARALVRAAYTAEWDGVRRLKDLRALRVPEGAQPVRLGVAGWVEDAQGQVRATARADCTG